MQPHFPHCLERHRAADVVDPARPPRSIAELCRNLDELKCGIRSRNFTIFICMEVRSRQLQLQAKGARKCTG